jgi:mRNA interferase RelE/StbE
MKMIVFAPAAAKQFDALEPQDRRTVEAGIESYAMTGRGDVKRLAGRDGFRLRIGRFRVLFDEDAMTILALYVGKRERTTYRRA